MVSPGECTSVSLVRGGGLEREVEILEGGTLSEGISLRHRVHDEERQSSRTRSLSLLLFLH